MLHINGYIFSVYLQGKPRCCVPTGGGSTNGSDS